MSSRTQADTASISCSNGAASLQIEQQFVVASDSTARGTASGSINLYAGQHAIRIEYRHEGGPAVLQVFWSRPDERARLLREADLTPVRRSGRALRWWPAVRALSVAIPIVWAVLLLYLPVRLGATLAWRQAVRVAPHARDRKALACVLLLGTALTLWGIGWGRTDQWAPDELSPAIVRDALEQRLSHGWHDRYPLMHYAVLAIPVSAFEIADRQAILIAESAPAYAAQLIMMRLVSVVMGLGTLIAAFVCGAELFGSRKAVLGALVLALTPLFAYYGKIANLDIPFMCWFGWALVAFVRIIKSNQLRDYVWLGIAAAAAVATKDQAYASLALLPLAVLVVNARGQVRDRWWRRLAAAIVDRRMLAAAGAAMLALAIFHNALFNVAGAVAHFQVLWGFRDIGVVPRSAGGYVELTLRTLASYRLVFGWPASILAVVGLTGAVARVERRWWLWLLLVPLSFHLAFTWVVLYVNDRYLFGGVFVLALFAGSALGDLMDNRRWPRAGLVTAAGALVYTLLYAASIDVMMNLDSRNTARRWLLARATDGAIVGIIGGYMPWLGTSVESVSLETPDEVTSERPDWVIVNARLARRFESARSPAGRELVGGLEDGRFGYVEVFRYRAPIPWWAVLRSRCAVSRRRGVGSDESRRGEPGGAISSAATRADGRLRCRTRSPKRGCRRRSQRLECPARRGVLVRRHLLDTESGAWSALQHHLEFDRVPVLPEPQPPRRVGADRPEPVLRVGEARAEAGVDDLRQEVVAPQAHEHRPRARELVAAAAHPAADHDVGLAGGDGRDEVGNRGGIVRSVGVQRHDDVAGGGGNPAPDRVPLAAAVVEEHRHVVRPQAIGEPSVLAVHDNQFVAV